MLGGGGDARWPHRLGTRRCVGTEYWSSPSVLGDCIAGPHRSHMDEGLTGEALG